MSPAESDRTDRDSNPYESPGDHPAAKADSLSRRGWTTKRRIAALLMATPFILALPLGYWVFNHAGGWLVSTELEPDHRAVFLGMAYVMMMFTIGVLAMFPAFVLLWLDRWHRIATGVLAVLFGILMIPTLFLAFIFVQCYFKYG